MHFLADEDEEADAAASADDVAIICGYCDRRDMREPPQLRERAEKCVLSFLDKKCSNSSPSMLQKTARRISEGFLHDFFSGLTD